MTFLPIVERELRVAARRRGTWLWRCVAALVVIFLGSWMFFVMQYQQPAALSKGLFGLLGAMAVLFAAVSGTQFTADSLSSEKREGTLGLLFLTDLKGFDVVLGKLAATSLNGFYGLLAILPLLSIPLLIGGVAAGEFWRMSLLAVNTLLMSLALGMMVSSIGRSARNCAGITLLGLFVLSLLLPFIGWRISEELGWSDAVFWFSLSSPAFAFPQVFDSAYGLMPYKFWSYMGCIHALTWIFLGAASLIAPRSWQDRSETPSHPWQRKWIEWKYGKSAARAQLRRRMLDVNPFYWVASRLRFKSALVWAVLVGMIGAWILGALKYKDDWFSEPVYVLSFLALNLVIKSWFATESTRPLSEDKQRGALELLLSTPLTVRQIMDGQRLALQRQFLGPLIVILGLQGMLTLAAAGAGSSDQGFWLTLGLASMAMLFTDIVAIYFVGLWASIRAPNPQVASSATMFGILVLPWIIFALCIMFLVMSTMSYSSQPEPTWQFLLGLWFCIGIFVNLLLSLISRERFLERFRELAASRFKAPSK
jgi:ABC-type Na+ efflux pump permease subunit